MIPNQDISLSPLPQAKDLNPIRSEQSLFVWQVNGTAKRQPLPCHVKGTHALFFDHKWIKVVAPHHHFFVAKNRCFKIEGDTYFVGTQAQYWFVRKRILIFFVIFLGLVSPCVWHWSRHSNQQDDAVDAVPHAKLLEAQKPTATDAKTNLPEPLIKPEHSGPTVLSGTQSAMPRRGKSDRVDPFRCQSLQSKEQRSLEEGKWYVCR